MSNDTTSRGFTKEQLYSTASYQAGALHGIRLWYNDLTGWNLAHQDLTDAGFSSATLTNADLSGATLTDASFRGATLTKADLSGPDTRGARYLNWAGAIARNTIRENGHIQGLELTAGEVLEVRDYDRGIAITIDGALAMAQDSILRIVLDDDSVWDERAHAWGSTIRLAKGIPCDLGGSLELTFAADANVLALVGTTFDLFDWSGPLDLGNRFDRVVSLPGLEWNLDELYTTGEVTLTGCPGPGWR